MISSRRGLFSLAAGAFVAAAMPAFGQVIIQERVMPAERVEVIPVRPHPNWTWVRGHWRWADRRGDWMWVPGHWVEHAAPPMPALIVETPPPAPTPRHFWVRGHWVWAGVRWQWIPGHWVI
jgi:hypothetical protein